MTTQDHHSARRGMLSMPVILSFYASSVVAIPTGYYDQVNSTSPEALRASLHEIIDDHQRFPYTSSSTDTWDILESADQDPSNPNNVIDIYKNASYPKFGGGNSFYNREHSWPKSYGFPNDGTSNYAYTDAHHLFIADSSYNSSRSNKPYANCDSSCLEKATELNNGRGGTSFESNWTAGSFSDGSWETWAGRKGDVARALMYMAVRYEGGVHGVSGHSEPDLILTDDRTLIANSNQGSNIAVAYMGLKSVLIQWHKDDPVDDFERRHNDTVYSFQGNRNPFVDHPEYAACVFEASCSGGGGDTTPPAAPTGFGASGGDGLVALDWSANLETDLLGYNVYRSDSLSGTYVKINATTLDTPSYNDTNVNAESTYFYKVTAVDGSFNESVYSDIVSATTNANIGGTSPGTAWINEFHYDNDGSDVGEFVEVAGTAGTNLNGWQLVAYNGNGGGEYQTLTLNGSISDMQNGFGVLSFNFAGLQNGGPDGIALVNAQGQVVQFLSYEGVMTASNGPASGLTSTDVGVSESSSTTVGHSLQLTGTGSMYTDFTWLAPTTNTAGSINDTQAFSGGSQPSNQAPVASFTNNCNGATCNFSGANSTDIDGSIVAYEWQLGDGASSTGVSTNHAYSSEGSYEVTLTVTDNDGATTTITETIIVSLPPAKVTGVSADVTSNSVSLNWQANSESDLAGYNVYRSNQSGGTYTKLNTALVATSAFLDDSVAAATTYYYKVTAVDIDGNESELSSTLSITTDAPANSNQVWINEFHYDNKGSDTGEFIELAGNAGTNLAGWQLVAYNGGNGDSYMTLDLSGSIPNQQNGFGTLSFDVSGLQNGAADGLALINGAGEVVLFISYEGTLTAVNGPAAGLTSEDIGVAESSSTRKGHSLQLSGNGSQYSDFTWQSPNKSSVGRINTGQSFN